MTKKSPIFDRPWEKALYLLCLRSDFANKEKEFLKLEFQKISQTRH